MRKSILTDNLDECIFCGRPRQAIHHVFPGTAKRAISEREGFIIPLCAEHHNMSDHSVHFNKEMALQTKQACQLVYEKNHTRAEFIKIIGRNYLGETDDKVCYE